MTVVQKIDRRQAQRFQAIFDIRFSINNGPEILSDTLNFTSRSLAIRSTAPAEKGDRVSIHFSGLPVLSGDIARVFPEGFAVVLHEASLAMMTKAHEAASSHAFPGTPIETINSPFLRPYGARNVRALMTSGAGFAPGYNQHFLSLIAADAQALSDVSTVWICAEATRWTASALRLERRKNRSIAVMALNDWQAHMGAAYGLKICIMDAALNEWSLKIAPEDIMAHLENLQSPHDHKIAVNA